VLHTIQSLPNRLTPHRISWLCYDASAISESILWLTPYHIIRCCLLYYQNLFNCVIDVGEVPESPGQSYTIPIPKGDSNAHSKSVTVNEAESLLVLVKMLRCPFIFSTLYMSKLNRSIADTSRQSYMHMIVCGIRRHENWGIGPSLRGRLEIECNRRYYWN